MPTDTLLDALQLGNPRPDEDSRIAMISLPVPLGITPPAALGDLPTQAQPVGWWPPSVAGKSEVVRRQLMFAMADNELPASVAVGGAATETPDSLPATPEAQCRIITKKNTGIILTEVNEVVISFGEKELGLRLGLRHGGENHWWEWVRIEELWSGPLCRAIRIGGFIEVEPSNDEMFLDLKEQKQIRSVHQHNWLRGEVYALMFANGVIQLTCRHVNNHLFDHGQDLEDVLPLIAFNAPGAPALDVCLDGSCTDFDLGGVQLNLADAATAFSVDHPGALRQEDDLLIFQPYEGVEIRGDNHHRERDDDYVCRAEDGVMPKGAARSLRFHVGLGEDTPVITRLTAPDWWYGAASELWGHDVLPAHDSWDRVLERCEESVRQRAAGQLRSFDNGILTGAVWEGEIPYGQMLYFYLSGDLQIFDVTLNDSYNIADIGFDHATETMRMHNFPFGAIAPPLYRTVAMTFAYLETGDQYLLECSESAASHFYWIDRHNWPRRSYGRDGASLRSLIFLWDYTGKDDYLTMAREALGRLIACQRPDGSYGDQGGTVGVCGGMANEIKKVWMAMMANDPIVDYLLRRPDDAELREALVRTADFVLAAQLGKDDGYYWAYEYMYGDNPGNGFEMMKNPEGFEHHPTRHHVSGYKARFLSFLTMYTGKPEYFRAWERFHAASWATPGKEGPGHVGYSSNKAVQNIPFAQAHRWQAVLRDGAVHISPMITAYEPEMLGEVSTPYGKLKLDCRSSNDSYDLQTSSDSEFNVVVHATGNSQPVTMRSNDNKTFALKEG